MKSSSSVLFLGKHDDEHVRKALQFCEANFTSVAAHFGRWGDPLPPELESWHGDYVISYLSRWVVPDWLLKRARIAAINFHPASPEYPGIGCNNFALYENASEYGATCHHMAPKVDTGAIIAVKRFPVFPADTVASVLSRTYDHQLVLFYEVAAGMVRGEPLPRSSETWTRPAFTRKQFNQLGLITTDMSPDEVRRRVRATSFGVWQPAIELHGYRFELKQP